MPSGETWIEELKNGSAFSRLPWQFNGKELDETGLYYYGARYYNPRNGVWMSPDPILAQYVHGEVNDGVFQPQNLGLYAYTWNNPVRLIDPNGLDPKDSAWIRIGKVALGVGYGVIQAATPGGFIVDTAATPSKDVDFLAGKGAANIAGGIVDIVTGAGAAAVGVIGEVPSAGTSTLVVAGGALAVAQGAANIATGANAIAVAIKGSPGGTSSGSPPAPAADVVTANGQKAAADGTRLGPSGKPEFHYSDSATRKQAIDGAKAQGSGQVVKDKATAKQPEHLHAVEPSGGRVSGPGKTHFNVRGAKPKTGE